MSSMSSELILRLRDGVSAPAKAIDGMVQRMGRTIASAFGAKNAQGFTAGASTAS